MQEHRHYLCLTCSSKSPSCKPTTLNYTFIIVEQFLTNYVLLPLGLPLACILNQTGTFGHSTFIDHFGCLSFEGVVQHRASEDTGFLFFLWSAGFWVANAVFRSQVGAVVTWLMFSCLPSVFVLQVCCDGLLLGPRSWRKT